MKKPSKKELDSLMNFTIGVFHEHGIDQCRVGEINPFCYGVAIDLDYGEKAVRAAVNDLFHRIPILAGEVDLDIGESTDYCEIREDLDEGQYLAVFNHPVALSFTANMPEYACLAKFVWGEESDDATDDDGLIEGIASGRLKSRSPDGYLVLSGEFYDEIEAGRKKIEYRDFTEYNLKRTIGLKTVRFSRGYGSKGKSPKQMRFSVATVVLMDDDNHVCDPFNVPEGFSPTTIALHLGQRIG